MSSELKCWINSRKYIRGQVTRTFNSKDSLRLLDPVSVAARISQLNQFKLDLSKLNSDIQNANFSTDGDEDKLDKDIEDSGRYFNHIYECLAILNKGPNNSDNVSNSDRRSILKSPVAPLPTFKGGEFEDYNKFINSFENTTNRFNYPDYDLFLLLKQQLSGRASILVESLELCSQSYSAAKQLLKEAFADPVAQRNNTIRKLIDLKLSIDDDPFEYISKAKMLKESVTSLNIESKHFLNFFIWNGLNNDFQDQITQITNKTKPDLDEIFNNFFDATERYNVKKKVCKINKSKSEPKNESKNVSSFATNVNFKDDKNDSKFECCFLCKHDNDDFYHSMSKCSKYSDSKSKVNKLNNIGGCTKCGHFNHKTKDCRFRLRKRCTCGLWHFSFLCVEPVKKVSTKPKDLAPKDKKDSKTEVKVESSANTIVVSEAFSNFDSNSVLPTFSCSINYLQIRAFRDQGCQSNFISSHVAESLNLKILNDNVLLNIIGFNSSIECKTKIVEVEIKFGPKTKILQAICIPEIKLNLDIPKLSLVAKAFSSKGYDLADKDLLSSDKINNIDFILGAKSAHCLKSNEISFGENDDSIYIKSDLGILLIGEINDLITNLPFLPENINVMHVSSESKANSSQNSEFEILNSVNHKLNCSLKKSNEIESNFGTFDNESSKFVVNEKTEDSSSFVATDLNSKLINAELAKAKVNVLEEESMKVLYYDQIVYDDVSSEINNKLIKYALENTVRNDEGRLVMPLFWRSEISHLLGQNFELAVSILNSNLKKLKNKPEYLNLMDQSFKDQARQGIIERIHNIDQFLIENPNYSFLPHMGVFKPNRDTTKCRVVYLSNLCQAEKSKSMTVSHNQAIYSGPCLNQKISSALLHLRFDRYILIYDLKKAFNQILLSDSDAARLLCVWFKDVNAGDFSLVFYRNVRLMFGLRCSPTILMLSLYKILVLDARHDPIELKNLKLLLYQLFYMDNGCASADSPEKLISYGDQLNSIFNEYGFELQQIVSNVDKVQSKFNPDDPDLKPENKLLGMKWDATTDEIYSNQINLDIKANTKRKILSSIASQFDIYNFHGPLMNRARIFMHKLQCDKNLQWDDKLNKDLLNEWTNIVRQVNSSPPIKFPRCLGSRSDEYDLLAFTDASKIIYGVVLYLHNKTNGQISFIAAKNRILNSQNKQKSVPSLELQAIVLGCQNLIDVFEDLAVSKNCTVPVKITNLILYCDSLVSLSWLDAFTNKYSKMNKRSVFVMNRLEQVKNLCEIHPIEFKFIAGNNNPADHITRCVSYKVLTKSNYISGPSIEQLNDPTNADNFRVVVPNPNVQKENIFSVATDPEKNVSRDFLLSPENYSDFSKFRRIYMNVFKFIDILKDKVKLRRPDLFINFSPNHDLFNKTSNEILKITQEKAFPEIFAFFSKKNKTVCETPNLVSQLNIFKDDQGLLRVKCKLDRKYSRKISFPVLLPKSCRVTNLIISNIHKIFNHSGNYFVLKELRKRFWVPRCFSVVKKVLNECITCKRFNKRTIKLNQNAYREERLNPSNIPYNYLYMDHLGPFNVKIDGVNRKRYLICFTCMWSRSINLLICEDLTLEEFLRSFQIHCFQWGLPSLCISDLGSQLVSGANLISSFLNEPDTQTYFSENGIKPVSFQQFTKGHSELGSMVECCVKLVKKLIFSSIGKNILSSKDFSFLIAQVTHMVNRRPIAFKDGLRDSSDFNFPDPITPEMITHGYELTSLNIIPDLHGDSISDPDWDASNPNSIVKNNFSKLKKVRQNLIELYNNEFVTTLISQATDRPSRFKPVTQDSIDVGNVVLIKEPNCKPINYPMGIIKHVELNSQGECTSVKILKGKTQEVVNRHVTNIIPLLSVNQLDNNSRDLINTNLPNIRPPSQRQAAVKAKQKIKSQLKNDAD